MPIRSIVSRILMLVALALAVVQQAHADDAELERGLINALKLVPGSSQRTPDSGKAIQAYIRAGALNKRPSLRLQYTDYWVLQRPAKFFGQELLIIEEEYLITHLGCCVNAGAGVRLILTDEAKELRRFAQKNNCLLVEQQGTELEDQIHGLSPKRPLPKGRYARLSCSELDSSA